MDDTLHRAGSAGGALAYERPAAAFSLLKNERGTAVEDTFVLMDDLLLEPAHPLCVPGVPLFGV